MNEYKVEHHNNGNIKSENYLVNGVEHRADGPAFVKYYENGNKSF